MSVEKLLQKTKQLVDDAVLKATDWHKKKLPAGYLEELSKLPDRDTLELAKRLFMEKEWRHIWSSVVIFQIHFHLYEFLTPGGIEEERLKRAGLLLDLMVRDNRVCFSTPSEAASNWSSSDA
jgi:hypothetical protein